MAGDEKVNIIVIKKGKKHKPHSSAWKVAYADFVTAMMAFFIVMWVLALSADIKTMIAAYFNDPVKYKSGNSIVQMKMSQPHQANPQQMQNQQTQQQRQQQERRVMETKATETLKKLKDNPQFTEMTKHVEVVFTPEGMKIELLNADAFFDVGTAKLKPLAVELLEQVGAMLSELPNHVIIEGHTDARPYAGSSRGLGYDNYNLSADRANAARVAILRGGLPEDRLDAVRGFADKELRNPSDPLDAVNRRTSILVEYLGRPDSLQFKLKKLPTQQPTQHP
jgi:chemotaxis protein MotB